MNDLWPRLLSLRADLVFAVGVVLAALVTVHVLLRKREVDSAAGWIGLAWFAPVAGTVAYLLLGINRVQRRARRERPSEATLGGGGQVRSVPGDNEHLDPLRRGIGRITARPVLPGNAIQVLNNGDEAYPPMLDAIAAARHSVGLTTFIFHDDEWGGKFVAALAAAQARGVAVRVLIDGIGGGWLLSRAYHALRRQGVPAERFLHSLLPWRMPFLNLRTHKKLLVLDGRLAFTGGMNISDANVMATHPKAPVQDTHFRVEGPVVGQLVENFAQDWSFATQEELRGDAWYPDLAEAGGVPARVIDSGPDQDLEKIEFAVLQAVACAREAVQVMTPYFLADERLLTALSLAAMRGVEVDVLVPEWSDHRFVDWASRANIGPLLQEGVRVWRCPPPFRHSKAMVVDGEWCLVGSCNWDMRSFRLNFELCLEMYDRDLAGALQVLMRRCRGPALTQAVLDRRSFPRRLRDAAVRLLLPYI